VLRRARDGVGLNVDEAALALTARGDALVDLCASAARVRDGGLESEGRRGASGRLPVSYSRKVFIPITHLCRDTCHYCTFVTVPGKLRAAGKGMYLEPDEILAIARQGGELGCKEALFTLGDRPEAGGAVDGDDVGDHLAAVVRDQGARPLRQPGQRS
jgi:FO synthase